jgi:hypothetical protein
MFSMENLYFGGDSVAFWFEEPPPYPPPNPEPEPEPQPEPSPPQPEGTHVHGQGKQSLLKLCSLILLLRCYSHIVIYRSTVTYDVRKMA